MQAANAGRPTLMGKNFRTAIIYSALIFVTLSWSARSQGQEHRFTADVGFGVTPTTGAISNRLGTGWNFGASAGERFGSFLSASLRFAYDGLGVNRAFLNRVGVPGGNSHVWSVTGDPKIELGRHAGVRPYAVGGVGYYQRTVNFTQPVTSAGFFVDPLFFNFPVVITGTETIRSVTHGGIGGSLGAGFDVNIAAGAKVFTEARYEYANTGSIPTRMVPVRFGIRW